MKENFLEDKSFKFAVRIVKLAQFLNNEKREYVLSKQIIRSGTAIGALINEAKFGESKAYFKHKLKISLKEANETNYWLKLLKKTDFIDKKLFDSLLFECNELIAILISSIKTLKNNKKISS